MLYNLERLANVSLLRIQLRVSLTSSSSSRRKSIVLIVYWRRYLLNISFFICYLMFVHMHRSFLYVLKYSLGLQKDLNILIVFTAMGTKSFTNEPKRNQNFCSRIYVFRFAIFLAYVIERRRRIFYKLSFTV